MTISGVLSSSLLVPSLIYNLQDIYDIVERNVSNLSSKKDWRHSVRGVLSSRKVGSRVISYHGNAQYSFS